MNVSVEESSACRKKLRVEVPAEQVSDQYNSVEGAYSKEVKIPGFRPGRAPRDLVRRRFGKEIEQEVRDRLIPKGYRDALEQENINPVAILQVEDVKLQPGKPLTFAVVLDVSPDFKLPTYKGISLKGEKADVAEDQIDEAIDHVREGQAKYEEVAERPVQTDDLVQIDYEGVCEGQPIEQVAHGAEGLGKGEDFWVHAGENAFLPGFGKGLTGMSIGDKGQVLVDFPGDFKDSDLAGRKATYFVEVKGIREKHLPEVNDDFVKALGLESADQLREKVAEDLARQAESAESSRLKSEIVKHLMSKTKMDLPESVVDEETRSAIYDMVRETAARGATEEQIEENKSKIFEAAHLNARDKVKARYLLNAIAEEQGIQATSEEIEGRIQGMAAYYGVPGPEMKTRLEQQNMLEGLATQVRVDKTLDFLLGEAKVKV